MVADEGGHPGQRVGLIEGVVAAKEEQPGPACHCHSTIHRVVGPLIGTGMHDQSCTELGGKAFRDVEGSIRGTTVHQDQLKVGAGLSDDAAKAGVKSRRNIERGNDDRKHRRGHGASYVSSVGPGMRLARAQLFFLTEKDAVGLQHLAIPRIDEARQ